MNAVRAGLIAAGGATLILLVARIVSGSPGFLEAVADGTTRYVPLNVFEALLSAFGPLAKGLVFAAVVLATVVAGGLLGPVCRRMLAAAPPAVAPVAVALATAAVADVVVLPVFGAGLFGGGVPYDPTALQVPLALAALAYAGLLAAVVGKPGDAAQAAHGNAGRRGGSREDAGSPMPAGGMDHPVQSPESNLERPLVLRDGVTGSAMPRRAFLGRGAATVGVASLVASGGITLARVLDAASVPTGRPAAVDPAGTFGPTPALTPVPDFYVVQKNLVSPSVDAARWRLSVDGLVDHPHAYTLDELRSLPAEEAYRTLECISDQVVRGDHLISNQRWKGVPVRDLLAAAGVQAGAGWILWESEDGYTESLPLDVARRPETWIAYEMGGQALTVDHGFPARVLVAGRFGMKQPKWVRRMQVADHDVPGYWEQRGWDEQAAIVVMSRIDTPAEGDTVRAGVPFTAAGIANGGNRGIRRVEVSADGGSTWQDAILEDANAGPLGPLTWVRWRADLTVARAGAATLAVRATDGAGNVQPADEAPPLPSGATGWHRVPIAVASQG